MILRDEATDYIDIITKICAYVIETKKISDRLLTKPFVIPLLASYSDDLSDNEQFNKIVTELPFTEDEIKKLKNIYKNALLHRLYEIVSQNGKIEVQTISSRVRYYSDLQELWIEKINILLKENFPYYFVEEDVDIHIVSSNTHSVLNCLSTWVHKKASMIINRDGHKNIENKTDQLYACLKELMNEKPELLKERSSIDKDNGIFHLNKINLSNIDVSIIDLRKLSQHIDPYLIGLNCQKKSILFTIDHAYGKQAEPIIRKLILLFGKKIKSISIFGKAGSITGERGELMIPNSFIIQENDVPYPIIPVDISEHDFVDVGWRRRIHYGPMLTVLGILMQNSEMLWFYRHFWKVIGMEMEGGYFLQEINRAKTQNLIDPNIILRFVYYISDPIRRNENLSK